MAFEAKLNQINIVVGDMDAMSRFYEHFGLGLSASHDWALDHRSAEVTDGCSLDLDSPEFAQRWDEGWPGGPGVVLGFTLATRDAVDRAYDELIACGYVGQQSPYDAFWGSRYAVVTDPDGNAVGLMSTRDPAFASPPPMPPHGPAPHVE